MQNENAASDIIPTSGEGISHSHFRQQPTPRNECAKDTCGKGDEVADDRKRLAEASFVVTMKSGPRSSRWRRAPQLHVPLTGSSHTVSCHGLRKSCADVGDGGQTLAGFSRRPAWPSPLRKTDTCWRAHLLCQAAHHCKGTLNTCRLCRNRDSRSLPRTITLFLPLLLSLTKRLDLRVATPVRYF